MKNHKQSFQSIAVFQRNVMPYRRPFFAKAAKLLGSHGYLLAIYSSDNDRESCNDLLLGTPHYVPLGLLFGRSFAARDIEERLAIPRGLVRRLWRDSPLVIVTEDISALPGCLTMPLLRLLKGTPYLIWTLGPSILGKKRSWWRIFARPWIELLRWPASGFITYSAWARSSLAAIYNKPTITAPNSAAIDLPPFMSYPIGADGILRLLFIGRLSRQKHVDRLIKAVSLTSVPVSLDILGDGEDATRLKALALSLNVEEKVQFHGNVEEPDRKLAFISQCHCGVMPGLGGLFIQELQAFGRPVITGPADGTEQDLVRAVNPDFYLEIVTPEALARLFERLVADAQLLEGAQIRARAVVDQFYNIDYMAKQWVSAVLATLELTE